MSRVLRLLPLLFVCSFASAALAQSADVSVTLTMDPSAVYDAGPNSAQAGGNVTVTNSGSVAAQNVVVDFDKAAGIDLYSWPGFICAFATDHYRCTAVSMAPGSVSKHIAVTWRNRQPAGTVKTTTVTVSSSSPADPNTANNSASANTTITWSANLQLEYIDSFDPITASTFAWVGVHIVDYGPSPATDVKMTLTIPPGATFSYVDSDLGITQPTCTTPPVGQSGDVVCTLQEWSPTEGHATIYVEVQVAPSNPPGTTLTLNGTVTSSDALKSPQSATGTLHVVAPAEISVAMTSPSTVKAGDSYDNVVTVTNDGPGPALHIGLTVSFAGLGWPSQPIAPAGWTCSTSFQSASCTAASLPPGTASFTFPASVPAVTTLTSTTQTAKVGSYNDLNSSNNKVSTTTTNPATPPTTLSISIAATPAVVHTGDKQTYTVQVSNTGSNPAYYVNVAAQLPGSVISNSCGPSSGPGCSLGTLNPGASVTATFGIAVTATTVGPLNSSATVSWEVPGSQTATTTTQCAGQWITDLAATLNAPAAVIAFVPSVWTIGIVNNGPDAVHAWDLFMNTEVFVSSVTTAEPGVSCSGGGGFVRCSGPSLPHGRMSAQVTIEPPPAAYPYPIHTVVIASASYSGDSDPHPENNTVSADSAIVSVQLSPSLTTDKTTAVVGERVTQTLTVTNPGSYPAPGVTANIALPAGSNATVTSTFSSCTQTTFIQCTAPTLAPGATLTATISFLAPAQTGSWKTVAEVFFAGGQAIQKQVSLVTVPPPPAADMSIAIDAAPTALNTGDTVTYTIGARNVGGSPASNVTVQLALPPSLTLLSSSSQCTGNPVLTCTAGTVGAGTTATFTVTARAVEAGSITETASVGNKSASATIVVTAPPAPSRRRAARH